MRSKPFLSLALVAVTGLLGACGTLTGKAPVPDGRGQNVAPTSAQLLAPLEERIRKLENIELRRGHAERDARSIAATVVAGPAFVGIMNCFEVPKQLAQSEHFEEFTRVMETNFAVACLYGAKKLEELKAKVKPSVPVQPKKK